jgi:hypothetical protein
MIAMVKVLWVSRHKPLASQIKALTEKLGEVEVAIYDQPIPTAEHLINIVKNTGAEVVVPVLPLSFIARLAEAAKKEGFTILFARMDVVAQTRDVWEAERIVSEARDKRTTTTYADGTVKVHEFKGFEKLVEVKLVTEPW